MDYNNTAIVTGYPTREAKIINKAGKLYAAFGLATQDSYLDKDQTWRKYKPEFHEVLISNQKLIETSKSLTTKDRIRITGSINYKTVKTSSDTGKERSFKQATIFARKLEPAPLPDKQ